MHCDNADTLDDFLYYLAKVNSVIDNYPSSHSCIIGDFNANLIDGCNSFSKGIDKILQV